LIELLAVVIIILILVSLLLPAIKKTKRIALKAVGISNMKQIATLAHLYQKDNRSCYPPFSGGSCTSWGGVNGSDSRYRSGMLTVQNRPLNKYLGIELTDDTQIPIYKCPIATNVEYRRFGCDYVANNSTFNRSITSLAWLPGGKVAQPSTCIMLEESPAFDQNTGLIVGDTAYGASVFWNTEKGDYRWYRLMVDGSYGLFSSIKGQTYEKDARGNYVYHYDSTLKNP
jgi:type II secretory pathway pseudopilin PulG